MGKPLAHASRVAADAERMARAAAQTRMVDARKVVLRRRGSGGRTLAFVASDPAKVQIQASPTAGGRSRLRSLRRRRRKQVHRKRCQPVLAGVIAAGDVAQGGFGVAGGRFGENLASRIVLG